MSDIEEKYVVKNKYYSSECGSVAARACTMAYAEMPAGRLRFAKCGRRCFIPVDSAEAWVSATEECHSLVQGRA